MAEVALQQPQFRSDQARSDHMERKGLGIDRLRPRTRPTGGRHSPVRCREVHA